MVREKMMKPIGVRESIILFGIPGFVLYVTINILVPLFSQITGWPVMISWFFCGGVFVFAPLLILALLFYQREDPQINWPGIKERFNLIKITKVHLLWMGISVIMIMLLTMITISSAVKIMPDFTPRPLFMRMEPLSYKNINILLPWLPFYFLNILGEEFFWRGYIFPRQELVFGTKTWLINGIFWLAFHIPFGIYVLITFTPALLIICWVVQRTKSTTVGILMHGIVNGMAFLLVALRVV